MSTSADAQVFLQAQLTAALTMGNPGAAPSEILKSAISLSTMWAIMILPNLRVTLVAGVPDGTIYFQVPEV